MNSVFSISLVLYHFSQFFTIYLVLGEAILYRRLTMTSFKQAKDMFKLQKQAKQIKKELKNIHVEAEAEGVIVTVNAEQEIVSITIAEEVPRDRIPALLTDALNRALKKAQVVATEKMQVVMNQMGMGAPEQAMGGIGNS